MKRQEIKDSIDSKSISFNDSINPILGAQFLDLKVCWSSHCGTADMNPTRNHDIAGSIPDHAQWVKDPALP